MQNFMQRLKWQHIMKSSPIKVRVDKSNIVIASDHISQSGQALLYPLDLDAGGQMCVKQELLSFSRDCKFYANLILHLQC